MLVFVSCILNTIAVWGDTTSWTNPPRTPNIWLGSGGTEAFDGLLIDGYLTSGDVGNYAKFVVSGSSGEGAYLNVWINFDADGFFNPFDEYVIRDYFIAPMYPSSLGGYALAIESNNGLSPLEPLYSSIEVIPINIPPNVDSDLYDIRIELNSAPQRSGEIVDAAQTVLSIVHSAMASSDGRMPIEYSESYRKAIDPMKVNYLDEDMNAPNAVASTPFEEGSENAAHQPASAGELRGMDNWMLVLVIVGVLSLFTITCFGAYECYRYDRGRKRKENEALHKARYNEAMVQPDDREVFA